jgi:pimeloyl-ACP methyl ester carboxylesterase
VTARVGDLAVALRGPRGATPALVVGPGPGFPLLHEVRQIERALDLGAWRTAYLEQRGCGRSRDGEPTIARSIDDVAATARWLADEAGAPVVVIGMSLGASYAVAAAARDPSPFRAIVGLGLDVDIPAADIAAHAFVVERGDRRAQAAAAQFAAPVTTSRAFQQRAKWLTELGGVQSGVRWGQLMRRTLVSLVRGYGPIGAIRALRAMPRVQDAMLPHLATWGLQDVRKLDVPLALVHGAEDAVSPVGLVRDWLDALDVPSATLRVVDGVGHIPHWERPDIVREALAAVVTKAASLRVAHSRVHDA